jgi:DNA polymerase V
VPESQVPAVVEFLQAFRQKRVLEEEGVRALEPRHAFASRRASVRLIASHVPAGFPSPADDYVEDIIDLNTRVIQYGHEAATFIVRASGSSMIGAGINDQDEVVVDRAIDARDGHIVVAAVNGELIIQRLRVRAGKVLLVSENPHYPERTIAEGEQLEIWGVATNVLHKL